MGFADMSFKLIVPNNTRGRRVTPTLRVATNAKGTGRISINRVLRERLGIRQHVEILVNGKAIAVRACAANAQGARRVSKNGEATITDITQMLDVRPGESYLLDTELDPPHAIGYLPDALVLRMRQRRGQAA